jgi:hypothetical protein
VTLSGDAEWPKVADAVIEAQELIRWADSIRRESGLSIDLHRGVVESPFRETTVYNEKASRRISLQPCQEGGAEAVLPYFSYTYDILHSLWNTEDGHLKWKVPHSSLGSQISLSARIYQINVL